MQTIRPTTAAVPASKHYHSRRRRGSTASGSFAGPPRRGISAVRRRGFEGGDALPDVGCGSGDVSLSSAGGSARPVGCSGSTSTTWSWVSPARPPPNRPRGSSSGTPTSPPSQSRSRWISSTRVFCSRTCRIPPPRWRTSRGRYRPAAGSPSRTSTFRVASATRPTSRTAGTSGLGAAARGVGSTRDRSASARPARGRGVRRGRGGRGPAGGDDRRAQDAAGADDEGDQRRGRRRGAGEPGGG